MTLAAMPAPTATPAPAARAEPRERSRTRLEADVLRETALLGETAAILLSDDEREQYALAHRSRVQAHARRHIRRCDGAGLRFDARFDTMELGFDVTLEQAVEGGRAFLAIEYVDPASAVHSQLSADDELVAIDGRIVEPIEDFEDVCDKIQNAPRPLTLTFIRAGTADGVSDERLDVKRRVLRVEWSADAPGPTVREMGRFFGRFGIIVRCSVRKQTALLLFAEARAAQAAGAYTRDKFGPKLRARVLFVDAAAAQPAAAKPPSPPRRLERRAAALLLPADEPRLATPTTSPARGGAAQGVEAFDRGTQTTDGAEAPHDTPEGAPFTAGPTPASPPSSPPPSPTSDADELWIAVCLAAPEGAPRIAAPLAALDGAAAVGGASPLLAVAAAQHASGEEPEAEAAPPPPLYQRRSDAGRAPMAAPAYVPPPPPTLAFIAQMEDAALCALRGGDAAGLAASFAQLDAARGGARDGGGLARFDAAQREADAARGRAAAKNLDLALLRADCHGRAWRQRALEAERQLARARRPPAVAVAVPYRSLGAAPALAFASSRAAPRLSTAFPAYGKHGGREAAAYKMPPRGGATPDAHSMEAFIHDELRKLRGTIDDKRGSWATAASVRAY
ncbi:hypothetical protein M885DRAFT_551502 [Pelagophyceae sp. CCMP2097]|nr:hypothetical protein M885DRAFT_551502 [Pelagophyceae sp. CCMP2097]